MKVSQAITNFLNFQKINAQKKYGKNYRLFLNKFERQFGDREIESVTSDEILTFLTRNTEGQNQSTKRFKYTVLKTFLIS